MKYMDNIDRDHSMSLDQSEFAWHYAAMTHTSAEAVFELLDENKDGKLTGKFTDFRQIFSFSRPRDPRPRRPFLGPRDPRPSRSPGSAQTRTVPGRPILRRLA